MSGLVSLSLTLSLSLLTNWSSRFFRLKFHFCHNISLLRSFFLFDRGGSAPFMLAVLSLLIKIIILFTYAAFVRAIAFCMCKKSQSSRTLKCFAMHCCWQFLCLSYARSSSCISVGNNEKRRNGLKVWKLRFLPVLVVQSLAREKNGRVCYVVMFFFCCAALAV